VTDLAQPGRRPSCAPRSRADVHTGGVLKSPRCFLLHVT
jgi:hypothetical protein